MPTLSDLKTPRKNTWCPGCGNFSIYNAVTSVMSKLDIPADQYMIVSGIGCHGKIMNYINVNAFHGIHGRVLPIATGIHLTNPSLNVIGFSGDADCCDEGWGHFVHAIRRNLNMTLLTHDNKILGLTTGQTSALSPQGFKTKTTPHGSIAPPINHLAHALQANGTFVARGFSGDLSHLQNLLIQAINHKGFSLIDILQPCVTFNKFNTFSWYRDRVYRLEETDYEPNNRETAIAKTMEWGDKIPIGLFYQGNRPIYRDDYTHLENVPLYNIPDKGFSIQQHLKELG